MKSQQNTWGNRVLIGSFLVVLALLGTQLVSAYLLPQTAVMHLASHRFDIKVVDDERTRQQGLSGTDSLPKDHAMLFVFETSGRWGIWMKDMNYSIDVIWLDESKRVVDYVTNIPPSSYPNRFHPKVAARYIVEVNSGVVKEKGIRLGDTAVFSGTTKQL